MAASIRPPGGGASAPRQPSPTTSPYVGQNLLVMQTSRLGGGLRSSPWFSKGSDSCGSTPWNNRWECTGSQKTHCDGISFESPPNPVLERVSSFPCTCRLDRRSFPSPGPAHQQEGGHPFLEGRQWSGSNREIPAAVADPFAIHLPDTGPIGAGEEKMRRKRRRAPEAHHVSPASSHRWLRVGPALGTSSRN